MREIMRGLAGSRAYGLSTPDSDYDWRGVFAHKTEEILGVHPMTETIEAKSTDTVYHEAGKFVRLALQANPNILEQFWLDEYTLETPEWRTLMARKDAFLSQRIFKTYGGYAIAQMKKLKSREAQGMVGFGPKVSKRTTKHARHLLRLMIQGQELAMTGAITVRLDPWQVDYVMTVSTWERDKMEAEFNRQLAVFDKMQYCTKLPREPNYDLANNALLAIREMNWK
jgi:predicted nucleotidyltransferase